MAYNRRFPVRQEQAPDQGVVFIQLLAEMVKQQCLPGQPVCAHLEPVVIAGKAVGAQRPRRIGLNGVGRRLAQVGPPFAIVEYDAEQPLPRMLASPPGPHKRQHA